MHAPETKCSHPEKHPVRRVEDAHKEHGGTTRDGESVELRVSCWRKVSGGERGEFKT
jgi:hypothetical protein